MTKKDFKVGDEVSGFWDDNKDCFHKPRKPRLDKDAGFTRGIIKSISGNIAVVKWEDYLWMDDPVSIDLLFTHNDADKELSRLEKEFKLVEKEVAVKLKEAAKLLKEANKIAKKTGNNLSEMYEAIDPLYAAMDQCGWQTSSFGC